MSKWRRKFTKSIMKSRHVELKNHFLPIRIRPWFVAFSSLVMLFLAFLGFTNAANGIPLNDKILHFICLGVATGVLYWVFDVEEDARRIWIWRHSGLIITGIICLFFGGIVSEVVQGLLPHKTFQWGDVVANLLGSSIGLFVSYHLERYYRHRREISRLYRPLDVLSDSEEDEDDMLLPSTRPSRPPPNSRGIRQDSFSGGEIRLGNVWDETDPGEIFTIGDEGEGDTSRAKDPVKPAKERGDSESPQTPKIIVTAPQSLPNDHWS